MTRATFRTVATFLALLSATAFSQTFTDHKYGTPAQPADIAVADLNRDARADIAIAHPQQNSVSIFLNHGDGTFTNQGSAQYLAGNNPEFLVIGDINGDGKLDIVTAGGGCSAGAPPVVNLLLGNGDGTFQQSLETQLPLSDCVLGLALTKVNSTRFDVAVANVDGTIRLLMNNGSAPLNVGALIATPPNTFGVMFGGLSSADYNRDGHWDLAASVVISNDEAVYLYMNDGAGHYTPVQSFTVSAKTGSHNMNIFNVNTVDVNGDGIADLLVPFAPQAHNTGLQGGVIVARNNGAGAFTTTTLRANARFFPDGKAAAGDITGDGFRDLIVPAQSEPALGSDAFIFYRGTSSTTWAGPQYLSVAGNPGGEAAAIGNFTGAKLDFAGTTELDNTLHVFTTGSAAPGGCSVPTTANTITVCTPGAGTTVASPVRITAAANGGANRITAMKAYFDGKLVASSSAGTLNASAAAAAGTHTLNVNAWTSTGKVFTWQSRFTVR